MSFCHHSQKYNERLPCRMSEKEQKFNVRLPTGMRDRIDAAAAKDGRSMNSQIVYYLELGLEGIDIKSIAAAIFEMRESIRVIENKIK